MQASARCAFLIASSTLSGPPMSKRSRRLLALSAVGVGLWLIVYVGNDALRQLESDAPSESLGQTNNGSLVNGKRLPSSGPGFATYSRLGSLLGRTATHHRVRDAVLDAYAAVYAEHPEVTLLYGETGWPSGGSFRPHRTHQNGLSVDFMVPVLRAGEPDVLPTHVFTKWGYGIDFDDDGQNGDLAIDFEMLAEHLHQLDLATQAHGLTIEVVILAPSLQDELAATERGAEITQRLRFSRNPSWVRHDDHIHVDFRVVET
ncbi:MAG: penicillin-insensitive murein endopeptidase [Bacteroidota bacterium]